jgi:hypothetical protein
VETFSHSGRVALTAARLTGKRAASIPRRALRWAQTCPRLRKDQSPSFSRLRIAHATSRLIRFT